jgi:hypothetical protein
LYLAASIVAFALGALGGLDEPVLTYTAEPGDTALEVEQGFARTAAAERMLVDALNVWLPRAMFPSLARAAPVVDKAMELYIVAYFFIAFRRVYETTIMGTLGRGLATGLLYTAVLLGAFVAIAAPTVWPLFFGEST